MPSEKNVTEKLFHDFRNWLYLLNAEMACIIAKGRSQDPAPHAAVQVPAAEAIEVFIRIQPKHATQRDVLLTYSHELQTEHFRLSKLNWHTEKERAGL